MKRIVATTSSLSTGVLLGAMLLIRVVLVPFWRSSTPDVFKVWFSNHAPRIRATMVPLGVAAATTTTANALLTPSRRSATSAAAALGVGFVTVAVNERLNKRFEGPGPLEPDDLKCWARWHDARVTLGLIAAIATALPSPRPGTVPSSSHREGSHRVHLHESRRPRPSRGDRLRLPARRRLTHSPV
jgi:hypothetical protein